MGRFYVNGSSSPPLKSQSLDFISSPMQIVTIAASLNRFGSSTAHQINLGNPHDTVHSGTYHLAGNPAAPHAAASTGSTQNTTTVPDQQWG